MLFPDNGVSLQISQAARIEVWSSCEMYTFVDLDPSDEIRLSALASALVLLLIESVYLAVNL